MQLMILHSGLLYYPWVIVLLFSFSWFVMMNIVFCISCVRLLMSEVYGLSSIRFGRLSQI